MHVSGSMGTEGLTDLLNDDDEYIRAWAIQLLCEDKEVSNYTLGRFVELANSEKSSVVRMYLAAALQRIDEARRWNIAEALVKYADDADDPNIPFMLWFGIEPLVSKDPAKALVIASKSKIPMVTNHISRRLVDADLLEALTTSLGSSTGNKLDLLKGMLDGVEGRVDIKEPSNWAEVYGQLKSDKQLAAMSLSVAQYFGNAAAALEMLALLKNDAANVEARKNAIKNLAGQQRKELINLLPGLMENKNLRIDAIRAVASYDQRDLGQLLLKKYDGFKAQEKQEAIQTLSSRTVYGRLLANAIKEETMPRKDIPAYIATQLRRVVGNGFVEIWGPIDQLSGNIKTEYQKYQRLITDQSIADASPEEGKTIFERTCAACHKMYGEGGDIGPDLTGSNRANTAYLLGNIIEPSGVIQEDYKLVVLTTRDGRTYSGNVVEENDRQVTMRIVGLDQVKISKSEIQSREVMEKSMMPEGLLNNLSEEEILDLVAYLKEQKSL